MDVARDAQPEVKITVEQLADAKLDLVRFEVKGIGKFAARRMDGDMNLEAHALAAERLRKKVGNRIPLDSLHSGARSDAYCMSSLEVANLTTDGPVNERLWRGIDHGTPIEILTMVYEAYTEACEAQLKLDVAMMGEMGNSSGGQGDTT